MKREFIKTTIPGITDEQLDAIMREHGNAINAHKDTITTHEATIQALTTERDGLKGQVADLGKDIKALQDAAKGNEGLSAKLSELQTKYDTDTAALQQKLDEQRSVHATERFFAGVEFTSNLARNAAMADFRSRNFKLKDDGTFDGADGYLDQLKKDNPAAFKVTDDGKNEGDNKADGNGAGGSTGNGQSYRPRFTNQMSNGGKSGDGGDKGPIPLGFHFVRQPPKQK